MKMPIAKLEHWMRDYYFDSEIDLGSSGVYPYSFKEVCEITGLTMDDLQEITFFDSPTVGCLPLRQAIANRYGSGNANDVMIANGSNEVLFHVLSTLIEPEDEVIALDPIYHALDAVPIAKGCRVLRWSVDPTNKQPISITELSKLVTNKTKAIAVNFPHNPTGITISTAQQQQIIAIAKAADAYLIWDAAFDELTTETPLVNPFLHYEKAISVGTLSKYFGLPGLRVGWCFAHSNVIQACNELRDYTTLYVSPLIELVATKVIENAEAFISKRRDEVMVNKALLTQWIDQYDGQVGWSSPQAGCSCLIHISGIADMDNFCKQLAQQYSVMLVPGSAFGLPEYARLGYGESQSVFAKGLELLDIFMHEYREQQALPALMSKGQ